MILTSLLTKKGIHRILPYLILLSLAILGYWQIALFHHPLKWDIIDQAFPWKYFIGESLQHHILPLWNPYQYCGYPIHADPQSSAWYPITWFFGYFWGYSIYVLSIDFTFHIFLAGTGMYLLGRKIGFQEKVALIMGTAYMFSGFLVGNAQHFMWIISTTWLPFILYAYIDLYQNQKLKKAVVFGLFMFLMLTGGYPAFTMILLYLLILLFVLLSYSILRKEGRQSFFLFFKMNVIALIFSILNSVVMLFSIWKVMPELTRTAGVTLREALFGPLSAQSLISFILPFGVVNHNMSFFGTDLSMTNIYFGLFLMIFFILSLFIKKPPIFKLFLFWGLFILSAAIGDALPAREFLYNYIPFFNIFRFPALLRIFVIISFIILAGYSLNNYASNEDIFIRKINISAFITGGLLLLIVAYFCYGQYINLGGYIAGGELFSFSKKSTIAQQIFFQGIVQFIFLGLFFILINTIKDKKKKLSYLFFLVILDLIFAVQLNAPYTIFEKDFSQKAIYIEVEKLPKGFPNPKLQALNTTNDLLTPHFVTSWRNLNIFYKQIAYDGYNPAQLKNFTYLEDSLKPLFKATIQNPSIYFGSSFYSDKLLKNISFVEEVDSSMIFLADEELQNNTATEPKSEDSIWYSSFSPGKMQVQTITQGQRFLVLLQSKYYGWKAEIDGIETPVFTPNINFMGVQVPEGEHQVTFYYKPKLVITGFYISLVSVIISVLILFFPGILYFKKKMNDRKTK